MTAKQFMEHPVTNIVANLVVTFVASVIAYKVIKYMENKAIQSTKSTKVTKQPTKIPVQQTTTTVEHVAQEEVTA